ncbi:MAG: FAD-dependent monooxygenase [Segniliparus sp.]|uniref:FAD-dependent monooxygenase n=1 Tax=Segniliparus sp. TaxID=2804064 RepID=UPI003F3709D1
MPHPRILICGAGIAGPAFALQIAKAGIRPTIVERASSVRSGGQAIDIRGSAVTVAERIGIERAARAANTGIKEMILFDDRGKRLASTTAIGPIVENTEHSNIEVLRKTLVDILHKEVDGKADLLFGDRVTALHQDEGRVSAVFSSGAEREYDLVVGADGFHSETRSLAFSPDRWSTRFLGAYSCIFSAPNFLGLDHQQIWSHTTLGLGASVYSALENTEARVVLGFQSRSRDLDVRDDQLMRKELKARFGRLGWIYPRLLQEMDATSDFYCDEVAQVVMDSYHNGRVALLGDAGYCPSPATGQGTSLALVGAYVLAWALQAHNWDHKAAFAEYDRRMLPFVRANQEKVNLAAHFPKSRLRIFADVQAIKLLRHERTRKFLLTKVFKVNTGCSTAVELPDESPVGGHAPAAA